MPFLTDASDPIRNSLFFLASHACPLTTVDGVHVWAATATEVRTLRIDDQTGISVEDLQDIVDAAEPSRDGYAILVRRMRPDGSCDGQNHLVVTLVDGVATYVEVNRNGLDRRDLAKTDVTRDCGLVDSLIALLRAAGRWDARPGSEATG